MPQINTYTPTRFMADGVPFAKVYQLIEGDVVGTYSLVNTNDKQDNIFENTKREAISVNGSVPSTDEELYAAFEGLTFVLNFKGGGTAPTDGYTKAQIDALLATITTEVSALEALVTPENADVNLDTVVERIEAIKQIQLSLNTILVNDLTTGGITKALTAEQGKQLKTLIDALKTAIDAKANTNHNHAISTVVGLQAILDSKQNLLFEGQNIAWTENDVAIYLSAGQSNNHGHGATMAVGDRITTPMGNVFTLKTGLHKNLTFNSVAWEGLTSLGDCNLGATNVDHLYTSGNEFARQWQNHINAGNTARLPNLYIITMSTGGQGMFPNTPIDAWSFTRNSSDINSLFPRYMKTLRLAIENLRNSGKNPRIIVQNYNQWEAEADAQANNGTTLFGADYAKMHFLKLIESIKDATGCPDLPFDFYYPLATTYPAANVTKVRNALTNIVDSKPLIYRFNDVRQNPSYTGTAPNFGVFQGDNVHYTGAVQQWFGQQQFNRVLAGYRGVSAGLWAHHVKPLAIIEQEAETALSLVQFPTSWYARNFTLGTNIKTASGLSFDVGTTHYTFNVGRTSNVKNFTVQKTGLGANTYGFVRSTAFVADSMNGEMIVDVQSGAYPSWLGAAFRVSTQGIVGGGFNGVPYSYIGCNFSTTPGTNTIVDFNVWVLWNSTLNVGRDRRLTIPVAQFARPLPTTGNYRLRIRLINTTVFVQFSTDGTNWLDILTSDNTTAGTPGKTFTFDSGHSTLTNLQTNGGVAGFIMGLGTDNTNATGILNGFEFNPLP